jgi:hypothetical protein
MAEIVFIPQPNIQVERYLLMMQERVEAIGARRVAIDSVSVFLHKVTDRQVSRKKFSNCAVSSRMFKESGFSQRIFRMIQSGQPLWS